MKKRLVFIAIIWMLVVPLVLAHGEETLWQKYDWYFMIAGIVLFLFLLFKLAKKILKIGIIIGAALLLWHFIGSSDQKIGVVGDIHYHADFKIYLEGEEYNFSQEKYMSTGNITLSNFVHFHDGNGRVIHKHAEGITLGFFLETLGLKLNESCLVLDDGKAYCNQGDNTLKMYVNGKENSQFETYDIADEDRILLSYGDQTEQEIQKLINSVSEDACIYSLTCPEKGTPPEEATCVGETCTVEK